MKRAADVPSLELNPRNVGMMLGAAGVVVLIAFVLGARMGRSLVAASAEAPAPSERPSLTAPAPEAPAPEPTVETPAPEGDELDGLRDDDGAESGSAEGPAPLGAAAREVLEGLRGSGEPSAPAGSSAPAPADEPTAAATPSTPAPVTTASAAPARPTAPPPAPSTPAATPRAGTYTLQILAGRSKQAAEKVAEELKAGGWPAYVERAERGAKGVYFRVRVGSFDTREDASRELGRFTASQRRWKDAYVTAAGD